MDSEKMRIEKLLRDGKLSPKDAQKLLDALGKSPGKEKKAGQTDKKVSSVITKFIGGLVGVMVLALLVYVVLLNQEERKEMNLLMNPGFEKGAENKVSFWSASYEASTFLRDHEEDGVEFVWDRETRKHGEASVSIRNRGAEKLLSWRQSLKTFPKGKKIKLIGYIKTRDVANSGAASLVLRGLKGLKEQTLLATTAMSYDLTGSKEWTRVQVHAVVGIDTEEIQVLCQLEGSGEVWCDDLELRVVE